MNVRVPVYIQPVSETIKHLPTHFNSNEYDTLSSLNLPMNESGTVAAGTCAKIALGYRIILPRGCIGMIKERKTILEETPFHVLAGILDCNAIREHSEFKIDLPKDFPKDVGGAPTEVPADTIVRMHPEVVLYVFNCGTKPLEYIKGKSIVQLFILPVYESQIQSISHTSVDPITIPLRSAVG